MSCYGSLAGYYDKLTGDVPYSKFIEFYEAEFARDGGEFRLLLDLCCGTGTLTCELARRGYEMIAADASVDMLMQAREKSAELPCPPLFLCQDAAELDLYGVRATVTDRQDGRPGGLLIFDIRTPEWLRALDGDIFVDEKDDVLCLWRADFDEELPAIVYGMDIFSRVGRLWERGSEEHIEYAHEPQALKQLLEAAGFTDVQLRRDCPQGDAGRMFIVATRNEE